MGRGHQWDEGRLDTLSQIAQESPISPQLTWSRTHFPEIWPMPRTVLIVDDERDTNEMLAAMVQTREFKPIQLFSGSQVLAPSASMRRTWSCWT